MTRRTSGQFRDLNPLTYEEVASTSSPRLPDIISKGPLSIGPHTGGDEWITCEAKESCIGREVLKRHVGDDGSVASLARVHQVISGPAHNRSIHQGEPDTQDNDHVRTCICRSAPHSPRTDCIGAHNRSTLHFRSMYRSGHDHKRKWSVLHTTHIGNTYTRPRVHHILNTERGAPRNSYLHTQVVRLIEEFAIKIAQAIEAHVFQPIMQRPLEFLYLALSHLELPVRGQGVIRLGDHVWRCHGCNRSRHGLQIWCDAPV